MSETQPGLDEILAQAPVIPVLTIADAGQAVPLARALVEGGIRVLEITLRTKAGIEAIAAIIRAVPQAVVGAGTVNSPAQYEQVKALGARFCVSPGFTGSLRAAAGQGGPPFLPGAATPSEMLALLESGYRFQKFFPAEPAGGIPMLKAIAAPIREVSFCPTGGITAATAPAYLALENVVCVGGSWLVPEAALRDGNWQAITRLAEEAAALRH
ncbi:MAG TPA: bifunctional 4-hydroxy-2-oxoglutarate aldolase/2-dehydro-3-deoxy-phosphogluconate aldolase [Acetobacteraceae bacterium]|nr:bifunctional 4-hydroxy-2-oxoglutarate aldolase/2-dehydro-3-deoxy-phosphogluconate aldolase [Acetobacteraceae bacterium]